MKKFEVKELTGSEVLQVSGGTSSATGHASNTGAGHQVDWKADVNYDF